MILIYLVFGKRINYHYETVFSICSFLAKTKSIKRIFIYTDAPEYYKCLESKVELRVIDKKQLEEWEGEHKFFWRVKIKAVEDVIRNNPGEKIVYLDSDTFIYKPTSSFEKLFEQGNAFMHKVEAPISNSPSGTQTKMWKQMKGKTFEGITIHKDHGMWNAGFIAIPVEKQSEAIGLALRLCDAMCAAGVTRRLIEQFAFSLALQETYRLLPAEDFVGHYWGNKEEWDVLINNYVVESYLKAQTLDENIENLKDFDFTQIPYIRKKRTHYKRINKFLLKCFPDKETFIQLD